MTTTGSIRRIKPFRFSILASNSVFLLPPRPSGLRSTSRRATPKSPANYPSNTATSKIFTSGDKRMELNVVPPLSAAVTPALAVIPASGGVTSSAVTREVHVSVTNGTKGAAEASVSLELPQGWKATPASVPLSFTHEDEALSARFEVVAPAHAKVGQYALHAVVTSPAFPNEKFSEGYQVIEYPHIQRRQVIKPAEATLKVVDVKVIPEHRCRLHRRRRRSGPSGA